MQRKTSGGTCTSRESATVNVAASGAAREGQAHGNTDMGAVVEDDVLLIASRPERSGGVHNGVFIQFPRGQLPQGSLGGRCKPAAHLLLMW
eukprot:COSAG01_NODE_2323_length_7908_cov_43.508388_6_plen_91_part_00